MEDSNAVRVLPVCMRRRVAEGKQFLPALSWAACCIEKEMMYQYPHKEKDHLKFI
jgi:hypothetical protein